MSDIVIQAENLGKKYTIGHQTERGRYVALRDVLVQNVRGFWRTTTDLLRGKPIIQGNDLEEVWALKDVSFEIRRGETVGIIGRNGAGKSTLLKVLSRITEPSAGRVTLKGRVASLLEVGTGFHPELTGRENVYLNGAILGMTRAEVKRKFDEIVAFAEIEKFLDTPVKRYSSGMYVRLAFSVAAHLEPEILLVDEVLAVGDAAFQKKCLGKMGEVASEGRTVLFVSHNMAAVENLCPRSLWLDNGQVQSIDDTREIIQQYLSSIRSRINVDLANRKDRKGQGQIQFSRIELMDSHHKPIEYGVSGEELVVRLHYTATDNAVAFQNCRVSLEVHSQGGVHFLCSTELVHNTRIDLGQSGHLDCMIDALPLSKGEYYLNLFMESNKVIQDWIEGVAELSVVDGNFYGTGKNYPPGWEGKGTLVKHRWEW